MTDNSETIGHMHAICEDAIAKQVAGTAKEKTAWGRPTKKKKAVNFELLEEELAAWEGQVKPVAEVAEEGAR